MPDKGSGAGSDKELSELLWINPSARMVRQEVVDRLRQAIRLGRFSPGQRLLERDLCEWTGVSRTSVREALRQLESEGLVATMPRRGPAVAVISAAEVKDIYDVRMSVECRMIELFVARATDRETDRLVKAADALRKATKAGGVAAISAAKDRFFEILMDGCGNPTLTDVVRALHGRLTLVRSVYLRRPERWLESANELVALANAVKARDAKRAVKRCRAHLSAAAAAALSGGEFAQGTRDRRVAG